MNHFATLRSSRLVVLTIIVLGALALSSLGQANVQGQWSTLPFTMPINPVHVALLYNSKVLIVAGSGNCPPSQSGCPSGPPYGPANASGAAVWDPVAGTFTQLTLSWDMFCNSMVVQPDGRVLINGGTIQYDPFHGELKSAVFDPATNVFTDVQRMAHGRWYPTLTALGDGRIMTFSGLDENGSTNSSVEIYTVGSGWSQQSFGGLNPPLYPRMSLLPNGQVFYSGSGTSSALFDPSTTSWTLGVATTKYGGTRTYGTSVLLPLTPANNYDPVVMIMGGGSPATNTTELIDLGAANPAWKFGPNMSQPRIEMGGTLLPNGKVLVTGGSQLDEDTSTKSLNADLYDPTNNTFSSAGANAFARLYHSVSLLLPDATVLLAGGNPNRGSYEQHMEIYKPAYLFNSNGTSATRPTITSAPSSAGYGNVFTVQTPDAATIATAVLVKPGSPTHAFDQDQRLVGLSFTAGSGVLNVTAPPNGNIAPPGYYMLFILNAAGVPSVATMIQLGQQPDFSIAATPSSQSVAAGGNAPYTVTVSAQGGFSGIVGLSVSGLPSGATAIFNPTSLNGSGSSTMTVTTSTGTPLGSSTLTITGTSTTLSHQTTVTLTVNSPTAPAVTSVSPNNGPTSGGTPITITGTNFVSGATVTLGGTAAANVVVVSGTQITATTPAHAAGAVNVVVTNPNTQSGTLANGFTYNPPVPIGFAQVAAATPQSPTLVVTVNYPGAQTAGNLNAVVVGWNDTTATVSSVTDSAGNVYNLAIGPTSGTGLRQSIYYAANIKAGANTVSVHFSQAAQFPDVRILEYQGVGAVDVAVGGSGSSGTASSGTATTTSASDLLLGANMVATLTTGAGAGFVSRIISSPDGDIAEDRVVTSTGSYSATAPLSPSGAWVMQMVAFKASGTAGPTVTSVSPNNGTISGGTGITITGTNFVSGATVTLGGTAATNVVVVSGTQITATAPAHAAGAVTVTVTNADTQSGNLANGYTYVGPAPTVTSVSPTSGTGSGGTGITITGTNFVSGATVTLGGTAATNVVVVSGTQITATTPAHAAGAVTVTVTNPDTQSGSLTNGYTYLGPGPTVTSVSPNNGTISGGTGITITGTNFVSGATVTLGGTAATNVVVVSGTQITATTPAHAAGAVTVTVTNADTQSGNLTNGYTYLGPAPTVTSVSPNNGTISGGTGITITGTNFASGATLTLGGTAATNVVVVSGTQITATTPAHAAGAVTVTVTNADTQSGSLTNGYTYVGPAPTVTSVSPTSGTGSGGTGITITGTNFVSGATVTLGGTAATNVVVVSGTQITATTPAHAAGAVTVTVTNPDTQSASLTNGYTYLGPGPTVTSVSPNNGTISGGTGITITGTNFVSGATVTLGGTATTNVVVVSGTQITATAPAHAAGAVTVTVTNADTQSGNLANGYTYVGPAPTVTSVSPTSGTGSGGTGITITGTNFVSGATVTLGGTAATNVVVVSGTQITATTPAHAAGAVTVTVTNTDTQSGSLTNGYTYLGPGPTVTSVSPNNGTISGGTGITITGTNFVSGATVTLGGTAATNVVVVSGTQITATTPAHAAGAVTVTVTNADTQSGNLTNGYTYLGPAPTVTSVSPTSGTGSGGTGITITGTNFVSGATVTLGGTAATNVVVASGTQITATTPAHTAGAVTVTVTNPDTQSASLPNGYTYTTSVAIGFGQVAAATPQSVIQVVTVAYPGAQTAGDLNVVVVGWNDTTATVSSVTDSAGNVYNLAIGPTSGTALRQSIYYAAGIKAGSNTVTVTFNQAAQFPDIRILEYRGLSAVDVTAGASGSGTTASTGNVTTTSANELIFGAATVFKSVNGAGSGFTTRIITTPDRDNAEDRVVTATGTYSATAPLSGTGPWVMQMVTFK